MQIRVKPMGVLRQRLGKQELVVELSDGSTLEQLLEKLALPAGMVQVVLVNQERETNRQRVLHHNDEVTLLAPVAGGGGGARASTGYTLDEVQSVIRALYGEKDTKRGLQGCFLWFLEEVGELSAAIRTNTASSIAEELADTLAWLATLANVAGVDLAEVFHHKYGRQCPGCGQLPCVCPSEAKP
jgi:NTP pyrophosphatase (non-canonical NTP hydrolase)/molybdopterin converting factor small subunit